MRSIRKKSVRSRRKYGKKRVGKARQRTTQVNLGLQPFPARYIAKLKYSDTVRINSGVASFASVLFRINSLYDPDVTFTGHQPYGRDQLATIYNRYRVISVRYYIQAIAAASKTQILSIVPTNEVVTESDTDALREKPRVRSGIVCAGGAGIPTKFKGKIYLPSLVGKTKSQYMSDDRYQAVQSTDPNETCYLYLHAMDMDKTTLPDVYATVMMEFTVEFFDAHVMSQS